MTVTNNININSRNIYLMLFTPDFYRYTYAIGTANFKRKKVDP